MYFKRNSTLFDIFNLKDEVKFITKIDQEMFILMTLNDICSDEEGRLGMFLSVDVQNCPSGSSEKMDFCHLAEFKI